MKDLLYELLMVLGVLLSMVFGVAVVMIMLRIAWWLCEGILMGGWF